MKKKKKIINELTQCFDVLKLIKSSYFYSIVLRLRVESFDFEKKKKLLKQLSPT